MNSGTAAQVLSALALEGRLEVFRLLVRAGPDGVKAGEIASAVTVPASTLSANLAILTRAGLIAGRARPGDPLRRPLRPDARPPRLSLEDCCNGSPEVCMPLIDIATRAACCAADQAEHA
jgi:DNA-binding transcriptional ArsR family regulator